MCCNTCKQLCILFFQKLGASGVAVGEVCSSFDGVGQKQNKTKKLLGHAIIFHTLVAMGSAALTAVVPYPGKAPPVK